MAYREMGMMDIDQVMRRWMVGEGIRAIGRSTGLDRNTVRRIVRLAEEAGIRRDTPWPDEGKLQAIRQGPRSSPEAQAAGGLTRVLALEKTQRLSVSQHLRSPWCGTAHLRPHSVEYLQRGRRSCRHPEKDWAAHSAPQFCHTPHGGRNRPTNHSAAARTRASGTYVHLFAPLPASPADGD